jgi:molybdate transport system regulatory protein
MLARRPPTSETPVSQLEPKMRLWVVFDDRLKFGDGRARLLEVIDELGSLKQAVERFNMSYRNAWGYLRELEKAAGFKFLERHPGRGSRGGMRLTTRGRRFLTQYWRFRTGLDDVARRRFRRIFRP